MSTWLAGSIAALVVFAAPVYADDGAKKLADAGWAAYQRHELDAAEKLTRQALAAATTFSPKAAWFFNLGRILEARGAKAPAIDAYKQSLGLRDSSAVRAQLRGVDPAAADAADPWRPKVMAGPYPTREDWCKQWGKRLDPDEDDRARLLKRCAKSGTVPEGGRVNLPAWIEDLEVYHFDSNAMALAIEVGHAWYVQELRPSGDPDSCHIGDAKFDGTTVHGSALEVRYTYGESCRKQEDWEISESAIVVVGIGASKKPSITRDITIHFWETSQRKTTAEWDRKPSWNPDGSLDIAIVKAQGGYFTDQDTDEVKGYHALAFP